VDISFSHSSGIALQRRLQSLARHNVITTGAKEGSLCSNTGAFSLHLERTETSRNKGKTMTQEKRKHSRLPLHSKGSIQIGDLSIEAESENLSLHGAFVAAASPVQLNDVVDFAFADIPITAKAKVVRITDQGIGLQFENTLLD
jgi:hypothetical protein